MPVKHRGEIKRSGWPINNEKVRKKKFAAARKLTGADDEGGKNGTEWHGGGREVNREPKQQYSPTVLQERHHVLGFGGLLGGAWES